MRTRYSFYNFIVSTITAVVLPLVGFFKVQLFISLYGDKLNGLQVTMAQVITFLNVCELAYSLAFRQLLFKPLAQGDKEKVLSIYHGARKIFKITGFAVLGLGIVVALFFPFYADSPITYLQTVGMFMALCIPYGISYFLMGPNFVIIADQQEYKINIWIQTIAIVRMLLMIAVILLKMPFVFILIIEGLNILIANTLARQIALKNYPWLKEKPKTIDEQSFMQNAKYTIVQRLATLATSNTDNIVITLFMGYTMTSVYGVYSYLTEAAGKIINSAITSPINSFGNLFNDESGDSYKVFTEYFNFGCYIASIAAICLFIVMPEFIDIWMKHQDLYQVTFMIAFLFAINIFYMTMREPIIICRDANGLFKQAKNNAYLLAIVKVVLSMVLIQIWGITGVLLATLIAYWVVDFLYNPVLVYREVFKLSAWRYYKMTFSRLLIACVIGAIGFVFWNSHISFISGGFTNFFIACVILGVSVVFIITLIYVCSYESFRNLIKRIYFIFKRKLG
ncbi:MAG: polysaccharide biosynthesis C-terminal domain-containing protein [Erysipelotrichaceae bacterium]|nr:polysaccharide biosynthesis C-terminal domain-containing protein [Erysipelotrichaceae bacterium]MDY5251127.1 polysaccharide biosynthesis C-terminal domain-containing protein [Erysipelotrichaceae bacterium]